MAAQKAEVYYMASGQDKHVPCDTLSNSTALKISYANARPLITATFAYRHLLSITLYLITPQPPVCSQGGYVISNTHKNRPETLST